MNTTAVTWQSTAHPHYPSADYKNYCSDILCSDTTSRAIQRVKTDFHLVLVSGVFTVNVGLGALMKGLRITT